MAACTHSVTQSTGSHKESGGTLWTEVVFSGLLTGLGTDGSCGVRRAGPIRQPPPNKNSNTILPTEMNISGAKMSRLTFNSELVASCACTY